MQVPPPFPTYDQKPEEVKGLPPASSEPPSLVMHVGQKVLTNVKQKPFISGDHLPDQIAQDHADSTDVEYTRKYNEVKTSINGIDKTKIFKLSGTFHSKIAIRDFAMGANPLTGNILDTHSLKKHGQIQASDPEAIDLLNKEIKKNFDDSFFNQFYHAVIEKRAFNKPLSATNIILSAASQEQTAILSPLQAYFDKYGHPSKNSRTLTQVNLTLENVVITLEDLLEYPSYEDAENPQPELYPDRVMKSTSIITIPIREFNKLDSTYGSEHCNVRFRLQQTIKVGRRRDTLFNPMKTTAETLSNVTSTVVKSLFSATFFSPSPPASQDSPPSPPSSGPEPPVSEPESSQVKN